MTLKLDDYIALIVFFIFIVCPFVYYAVKEIMKEAVITGKYEDKG